MGFGYANADEIGVDLTNDLGSVEVGQTYSLAAKGDYYTFQPQQSGNIIVQTNYDGKYEAVGYDMTCFFFMVDYSRFSGEGTYAYCVAQIKPVIEDGGYQFLFHVDAGRNYVFGYGMNNLTSLDFSVAYDEEVMIPATMTYCLPVPGTTFDLGSGNNDITMEFDQTIISVGSVSFDYTDKEGNEQSIPIRHAAEFGWMATENLLSVNIGPSNNIFKTAKENADTDKPFYIVCKKVMGGAGPVGYANLYNGGNEYVTITGDGDFTLEYEFIDNVSLVSAVFPETFYSYWEPGSPDGMATLTFDGPVNMRSAVMSLTMGTHALEVVGGDFPDPAFKVDYSMNEDKTVVTLNFTGVDYSKPLTKEYKTVTLIITGVTGENGLTAFLGPDGSNIITKVFPYVNEPYEGAEIPDYIEGTPTFSPAQYSVIRELQEVTVEWPEPVSLVEGMDAYAQVELDSFTPQPVDVAIAEGALLIDLTQVVLKDGRFTGTATITVPAGIVKNATGDVNDTLTIIYTFAISQAGVEEIIDGYDSAPAIYNLKGVKVDSKDLTPGIYIINGRKVVMK